MDSEKVIKRDNEYVLHTYNRNPVVLEKGHGLYAEGPEGQKYLDFTSGIGVNSLGYCDLAWAEAVSDQAHKLQHTSNLYYTAPCGKLAKKLCKRTGQSRVFFGNSGAEANEGAIKAARKYSVDHYGKDRTTVITLVNSFHGRTIATLTATGQEVFHNYFGPFNEGFLYAPAGDIEALQELVDRNTCAVMLELIQGEGGVMALDPDYVQAVRKLCDEKDLVLIVDEVQTGVGRTGTFLCCEHYNLKPDIVTLAKGLGGGLPIGAVLLSEKVAGGMGPGTHGSTFGGNPVVCAGANVVVDRMDTSFLANVNDRAVQLRAGIAKLPHVKSISGIGLMVGIEFYDVTAADVLAIVNVVGSSIARAADYVMYTYAGPEIAVASTKAYMVQLCVLYLFALRLAYARGRLSEAETRRYTAQLLRAPEIIKARLADCEQIKYLASRYMNTQSCFFIGRGFDYSLSLEGSLKLKEISYVHSDAYAAGELKHGTISLITDGVPVIALATQKQVYEKTISNAKETRSRGARVLLFTTKNAVVPEGVADAVVRLDEYEDLLMPLQLIVPLQLFAYYMAVLRGCDVDKPRNLAKSVTVE